MRCKCGKDLTHTTSYTFKCGKKFESMCDECYAEYLASLHKVAKRKVKKEDKKNVGPN